LQRQTPRNVAPNVARCVPKNKLQIPYCNATMHVPNISPQQRRNNS